MDSKASNEDIYYISDYEPTLPFYITIAGITYPDSSYHIKRKCSKVISIEYILDGKGTVILDEKTYIPEKGDVYILALNKDHEYYSDSSDPWKKIWFNASGTLVDALINSYGLKDIVIVKESGALSFFERILSLCSSISSKSEINEKSALIFHELIAYLSRITADKGTNISKEVLIMREYIDNHLSENVSTEFLASLIYKSKSQAIRLFKAEVGTTPYDYLLKKRFSQAKSLLQSTNLLIKEISFLCGFSDEHYFSDLFKRKCGTSPGEYRNKSI